MGRRRAIKAENGQGSVYRRSDARARPWVAVAPARWDVDAMKYVRLVIGRFETAQEAKDALALFQQAPTDKYNITVEQLHEEWMEIAYRDLSKQSKDCYNAAWAKLRPLYALKFREVRTVDMQRIVDELADSMSVSSLRKIRVLLSGMYKYAMQQDIVSKNYASFLVLPPAKANKDDKLFYDNEIAVLRRAADGGDDIAAAIMLMIYTGFRIGEFLALTRFSYDAAQHILIGGNKTKAGRNRKVPVHPDVQPYLDRWLAKGGDAIVCTASGKKMRTEYFREQFYACLDKHKLRRVTPHATRHTCSTRMAAAGVRPEVMTAILGHEDYSMDVSTYIHPSENTLLEAMRLVK